jgi:hypothetical protein
MPTDFYFDYWIVDFFSITTSKRKYFKSNVEHPLAPETTKSFNASLESLERLEQ